VPKDEFVEVYLELGLAYTVVRTNEPLLEVANSPIGKWDGGLRTFSQLRAERLDASDMSKAGLNETCETLEAVRIDGPSSFPQAGKRPGGSPTLWLTVGRNSNREST
jgi:hypothetical protein